MRGALSLGIFSVSLHPFAGPMRPGHGAKLPDTAFEAQGLEKPTRHSAGKPEVQSLGPEACSLTPRARMAPKTPPTSSDPSEGHGFYQPGSPKEAGSHQRCPRGRHAPCTQAHPAPPEGAASASPDLQVLQNQARAASICPPYMAPLGTLSCHTPHTPHTSPPHPLHPCPPCVPLHIPFHIPWDRPGRHGVDQGDTGWASGTRDRPGGHRVGQRDTGQAGGVMVWARGTRGRPGGHRMG